VGEQQSQVVAGGQHGSVLLLKTVTCQFQGDLKLSIEKKEEGEGGAYSNIRHRGQLQEPESSAAAPQSEVMLSNDLGKLPIGSNVIQIDLRETF
jgi:hypothetical protein